VKDGPVEVFLAELARHLKGDEAARQRVVLEVGDHLRDLVGEGRAHGLDEGDAESEAVGQFGSPHALARALRPSRRRSRPLIAGAAVTAITAACGGIAFAALRGTPAAPSSPPPTAAPVAAASASPTDACFTAFARNAVVQMLKAQLAYQTDAVDSQYLLQIGTRVALDPHTGRVLSCVPAAATGGTNGVWLVVTPPSAPFGQTRMLSIP
jgi:hypothetical protein